jgi:2-polyprenyl-6-methoxyphenol hydroxylase-like FAD-dependent oxidoreductase
MMATILVLGAGMNGLSLAMLLAQDGHDVTVLERDANEPVDDPEDAWTGWERRGVGQFRMLHFMLPRWRSEIEADLPEVLVELEARGGLRMNTLTYLPDEFTGGFRPGDERFETLTARRPVLEGAVAAVAGRTPAVRIRRGVVVNGLTTNGHGRPGIPHVTGVVTEHDGIITADLVVDASGRRSALPAWLAAIDARPPTEERDDSGFVYYGRHFRSADGDVPPGKNKILTHHDSLSILTLPADNGTWGVGLITSARDKELRSLRDTAAWERALAEYPLAAHWMDGEPISDGVAIMAAIEDRYRSYVVDGDPVVTGVVAVGDAWSCTNPSLGRGTSIGILHAKALRDILREIDTVDHEQLVRRFDELTRNEIEPWYRRTLAFDRHRLAEIEADIAGQPYESDDPVWQITKAWTVATNVDSEVYRAYVPLVSLQSTAEAELAQPGLLDRILAAAAGQPQYPDPGPDRAALLKAIAA